MNRRSKLGQIALAVLLVLGLMLTVVACGNSEQSNNEGNEAEKPVVYKVGTEPTFAPFEYKDIETDEITGFDIDLIKAIAVSGFEVEIQGMGFDALIPALQGTIDIVASGMTIDEERSKQVDLLHLC